MSKLHILKEFDPRQLFRFFVDGRLYTKENGWEGYESRQPGCISGIAHAYAHMVDNFDLSQGLTLEYISKLHDLTFLNIDKKLRKNRYPGQIREFRISFLVKPDYITKGGIAGLMGDREVSDAFKKGIRGCKTAEDIYNAIVNGKTIRYVAEAGELSPELNQASLDREPKDLYLKARVQIQKNITAKAMDLINEYNDNIDGVKQENKIYFMADIIRRFERLHPFVDGNIRVLVAILFNHLLMYHGFSPTLYEDPSIFDAYTTQEIMDEVIKGQTLVAQLLQEPQSQVFGHSINDESEENIAKICELMSPFIERLKEV